MSSREVSAYWQHAVFSSSRAASFLRSSKLPPPRTGPARRKAAPNHPLNSHVIGKLSLALFPRRAAKFNHLIFVPIAAIAAASSDGYCTHIIHHRYPRSRVFGRSARPPNQPRSWSQISSESLERAANGSRHARAADLEAQALRQSTLY